MKYKWFIPGILVVSLAVSCEQKNLLDPKSSNELNEQTVFTDSARTIGDLMGCYNEIGFAFGYRRYTYSSNISCGTAEGCDESVSRLAGSAQPFVPLFNGTLNALETEPYRWIWQKPWENIRRCNVYLAHVDDAPLSPATKIQTKAEARFLRAWYYSILLKNFGGVPLIGDKVIALNDPLDQPRDSYEDCVNFIVNEMDAILNDLPVEHLSQNYGRVTRGACLALKSRVLLYAASPYFNGGSNATSDEVKRLTGYLTYDKQRWQKAADAAKAVIDMNEYSLYEDNATAPGYGFSKVFLMRKNPEYILPAMAAPNKTMEGFALPPTRNTGTLQIAPSENLAEAFGMINGLPITDASSGFDPQNPYVNRDPRFKYTFIYNGTLWYSASANAKTAVNTYYMAPNDGYGTIKWATGYYWRKMMDENTAQNGGPNTDRCLPLIRYAEILLNYAEASNEMGNTSIAYDMLKLIRKRAGIIAGADGSYGLKANMTVDEMRAVLQNEREVELAYEDHRYWDVRRWKIAPQVMNFTMNAMKITPNGSGGFIYEVVPVSANYNHVFKEASYLFPIMQSELAKNPNFLQNPGY